MAETSMKMGFAVFPDPFELHTGSGPLPPCIGSHVIRRTRSRSSGWIICQARNSPVVSSGRSYPKISAIFGFTQRWIPLHLVIPSLESSTTVRYVLPLSLSASSAFRSPEIR